MIKIIQCSCILALAFLLNACIKDKGNYDYSEVNSIVIKGMENEYFLYLNRRVNIQPQLEFSKDAGTDPGRYKYEWVTDGTSGYTIPPDTFCRSRDLDTVLLPKYGCADYYCYFRVTDTVTGLFSQKEFLMHVVTPSYEGWLMLCDMEDGTSRLDMISQQGEKDTLYRDVLKTVGSTFPMQDKPAFVASGALYFPPSNGLVTAMVGTSKTASTLGMDTLDYKSEYDLNSFMEGDRINDFTGSDVMLRITGGALYAQNNIYIFGYSGLISTPVNYMDNPANLFKASRFMATDIYNSSWMFFNTNSNRLVRWSSGACEDIPAGDLFDYAIDNNASGGMELVYMEPTTYSTGDVFLVLKAKQSGKFYLGRCAVNGTAQYYYKEIKGTDIENATHFAVSPEYGHLFYEAGGKIYEYDINLQKSFMMKDYGGRKITQLKFNFMEFSDAYRWSQLPLNYNKYSALRKKLLVATYEPADPKTSGVLDIYTIPSVNQPIQLYKSYTGTGKIVSIAFRER
ncbi:PKD-like family lipoprotein [Pseudoflavitalea rhizosphaerae]|uniref:PKD-like family lipoprotein n=1 Tax=Pseudoflavitalea rhizosphaerae TaxID=1884793 RepID=UPI000F8C317C|nr:PKD-like family lipoprotein [Pseudoflavitalea rhizosphaerae]